MNIAGTSLCFVRIATVLIILGGFSDAVRASDQEIYILYLHGRIVENKGTTPTHAEFGLYDYPAIVEALGARGDTVISEARAAGTTVDQYARKTIEDIEKLIADGVSPTQIVVVGFSKGGGIAIRVSELIAQPDIRYVLLASCAKWISNYPKLRLTGSVLSMVETSDKMGISCNDLAERGDELISFKETTISTGKGHGAFYLPDSVWLDPVLDWIHGGQE